VTPLGSSRPERVDVRVVAATNCRLLEAVDAGTFREDLYARLAGVVLMPPPLRERREDILPLFDYFLSAPARLPRSADFVEALLRYDWPRNVRELKRSAERLPVLNPIADRWEFEMLDDDVCAAVASASSSTDDGPADVPCPPSRESLVELLKRAGCNVSRAAEAVGRDRKQLYRWMKKLDVEAGAGR
jgi:DNA-binding NtrC family response regulator